MVLSMLPLFMGHGSVVVESIAEGCRGQCPLLLQHICAKIIMESAHRMYKRLFMVDFMGARPPLSQASIGLGPCLGCLTQAVALASHGLSCGSTGPKNA